MNKQLEFVILWATMILMFLITAFNNRIAIGSQKKINLLFALLFGFMYSFRSLGMDISNYQNYYESVTASILHRRLSVQNVLANDYEPLFLLTMYISKKMGLEFSEFMLVIVTVPLLIIVYYINKNAKYPLITFFAFMLIMMFQVDLTRFFMAMPFIFIAFFSDRKIIKIFCYFIAFCFHYSSIFAPLCEVLVKFHQNRKRFFFIAAMLVLSEIILKAIDLTPLEQSSLRFVFKLQYYLNHPTYLQDMNLILRIPFILINVYPIFMCIYLTQKIKKNQYACQELNDKKLNKLLNFVQIGIVFSSTLLFIFSAFQLAFRLLLVTYFLLFVPISQLLGRDIFNGVLYKNGTNILISLFVYDFFMSVYYIGISIVY